MAWGGAQLEFVLRVQLYRWDLGVGTWPRKRYATPGSGGRGRTRVGVLFVCVRNAHIVHCGNCLSLWSSPALAQLPKAKPSACRHDARRDGCRDLASRLGTRSGGGGSVNTQNCKNSYSSVGIPNVPAQSSVFVCTPSERSLYLVLCM